MVLASGRDKGRIELVPCQNCLVQKGARWRGPPHPPRPLYNSHFVRKLELCRDYRPPGFRDNKKTDNKKCKQYIIVNR